MVDVMKKNDAKYTRKVVGKDSKPKSYVSLEKISTKNKHKQHNNLQRLILLIFNNLQTIMMHNILAIHQLQELGRSI